MQKASCLLKDFRLNITEIDGFVSLKDDLWKLALDKVVSRFAEEVNEDEKAIEEARKSMSALEDLSTATAYCSEAKKAYRYFGQERVRSFVSVSFREMLPFPWDFHWSVTTVQRRILEIQKMLDPIVAARRSRLLSSYPVILIATLMDYIWNRGAENSEWWTREKNMKKVVRSCLSTLKELSGNAVNNRTSKRVIQCVEVFSNILLLLTFSLGEFRLDEFGGKDGEIEELMSKRIKDVENNSEEGRYCFASHSQVSHLLKLLGGLDPSFAAETSKSVILQRALIRTEGKDVVPSICKMGETEDGPLFSVDEVLLDGARMLSDMWNLATGMKSDANEQVVGDVMRVLFVPRDERRLVNFKRLFSLALGFIEGVDVKSINISDLTEGLLQRLNQDGSYCSQFSKGTKNRMIKKGYGQKGPRHQPIVIVDSQWGGSDEDVDGPQHIRKRPAEREDGNAGGKRARTRNDATHPFVRNEPVNRISVPLTIIPDEEEEENDDEGENGTTNTGQADKVRGSSDVDGSPATKHVRFAMESGVSHTRSGRRGEGGIPPGRRGGQEVVVSQRARNGNRPSSSSPPVQCDDDRSAGMREDNLPQLSDVPLTQHDSVEDPEPRNRTLKHSGDDSEGEQEATKVDKSCRLSSESDVCSLDDMLANTAVATAKDAQSETSPEDENNNDDLQSMGKEKKPKAVSIKKRGTGGKKSSEARRKVVPRRVTRSRKGK